MDIFYHYRPAPETPLEETIDALSVTVRQGIALYVVISNYNAEDTRKAAAILQANKTPLLIRQCSYNMFDRQCENGLLDVLSKAGIGTICFTPSSPGNIKQSLPKGNSRRKQGDKKPFFEIRSYCQRVNG